MILMASALRWKEPSIDHEINLIHQQHALQTKLASEMVIPMPLPVTGGPHYEYRYHKKRIPFIASHESRHHHVRYRTSLEDEDDYDEDENPVKDRMKENPFYSETHSDTQGAGVYGREYLDEQEHPQLMATGSRSKPQKFKGWINNTPAPGMNHLYPPMYSTHNSSSGRTPPVGTGTGTGTGRPSGAQGSTSSPHRGPNVQTVDVSSSPMPSTTRHHLSRR